MMGKIPTAEIANRSYEVCEPFCQWREEKEKEVLDICVQGYKKSELHVEIQNGTLVIWGERRMDTRRWQRFRKDIILDKHWQKEKIGAQFFNNGKLSVAIPKKQEQAIGSVEIDSSSRVKLKKSLWRWKAIDGNVAFEVAVVALCWFILPILTLILAYVSVPQNC